MSDGCAKYRGRYKESNKRVILPINMVARQVLRFDVLQSVALVTALLLQKQLYSQRSQVRLRRNG